MNSFKVGFEGPSVDAGEIAVDDLAPSLLALGEFFNAANAAVNKDKAEVRLKIRATEHGSFVALLSLDFSVATDLLDILAANPDRVTAAKDLIQIIIGGGSIVATPVVGYFGALRFLKGKRADKVTKNEGGTTSIQAGGTTIIVDNRTAVLLEDRTTRETTKKFLSTSLKPEGVNSVGIVSEDDQMNGAEALRLTVKDIQAALIPEPKEDDAKTITQQREALLKIVSAHFEDGYLWRFTDGINTFTASMEDHDFINQINEATIQLSKYDTLRCLIEETQELRGGQLKTTARILNVREFIPGPRQLGLL